MDVRPNPRRPRRWALWLGGVAILAAVAVGVVLVARNADGTPQAKSAKARKGDKEEPAAAPVELSPVARGSVSTFLQTTGTLDARNAADLVARRQGQVVALLAEEGHWVNAGDALARLDDTEARLAVERAEVALEMVGREVARARQLDRQGFLSRKELDDLDLRERNAKVELEQARYELSQTRLVAPFSGRVVERMVNLGETVTPGRTCFRLADSNPLLVRIYFAERELPRVRVGQDAVVTLDTHPGREFPARVSLVNPAVDRANGTFKVTLELPNPGGQLRLGAFARVRLRTDRYANTLVVPRRSVLSEDGEDYVFVARGDSVVRAPVRLGAVEGDRAQILAGLAEGDRVVTVGQGGLKPGAKIKPVSL